MDDNEPDDDEIELDDDSQFVWWSLPVLHFAIVAYYFGPIAACIALYWLGVYWPICLVAAIAWPLWNFVRAAIQGVD